VVSLPKTFQVSPPEKGLDLPREVRGENIDGDRHLVLGCRVPFVPYLAWHVWLKLWKTEIGRRGEREREREREEQKGVAGPGSDLD
jgi:hypothetical protein